jgi:hypothetical protein
VHRRGVNLGAVPNANAPKRGAPKPRAKGAPKGKAVAPARPSGRYTAPTPKATKTSPLWVPVAMFTCLVLGVVVIGGNYLQLLPGGEASNNFLIIGLVLLVAGFVLSTFFR